MRTPATLYGLPFARYKQKTASGSVFLQISRNRKVLERSATLGSTSLAVEFGKESNETTRDTVWPSVREI